MRCREENRSHPAIAGLQLVHLIALRATPSPAGRLPIPERSRYPRRLAQLREIHPAFRLRRR